MSVGACRNVGIDIERWLREDLLDIMSLGNGDAWPNLPVEELVKLAHRYKVLAYPCLKYSGYGHSDIESWRAAASNAWRAGADGMYFFNHFPSEPSPQFKELGDPVQLATRDKMFAATAPHAQGHLRLAEVLPPSMALPAKLAAGEKPTVVTLQIGDDIPGAEEQKALASAVLNIRLSPPKSLDAVEVTLNGELLTPSQKDSEGGWLEFRPEPSWYRVGDNLVSMRLASGDGGSPVQTLAVECHVKYKK